MVNAPTRTLALLAALALGCATPAADEEAQLGSEAASEMRRTFGVLADPAVSDYVREIGAGLVRAAGPQRHRYRFYVLADENPYAYSAPGGYVFVFTGTLRAARSSADVAAILAHEIGHVAERHGIEKIDRERVAEQRAAVKKATSVHANLIRGGGRHQRLGELFAKRGYSWEQELEADAFALRTLAAAGWCPRALPELFAQWRATEEPDDPFYVMFASTHPPLALRIQQLEPEVERLGPCTAPPPATPDPLADVQGRLPPPEAPEEK